MEQIRDITISHLTMDLRPETGNIPFTPVVHALQVALSNDALIKAVKAVLVMSRSKLPVEVEFEEGEFVPGGAEITVSAGLNRFLKAKATAVLGITASNSQTVSVEIQEIRTLGKIPIEGMVGPLIDKGLDKAAQMPGIGRDPARNQGLLINPDELLKSQGIPLEFAKPGGWTVESASRQLTARYESM
jgi:hypothetical protein